MQGELRGTYCKGINGSCRTHLRQLPPVRVLDCAGFSDASACVLGPAELRHFLKLGKILPGASQRSSLMSAISKAFQTSRAFHVGTQHPQNCAIPSLDLLAGGGLKRIRMPRVSTPCFKGNKAEPSNFDEPGSDGWHASVSSGSWRSDLGGGRLRLVQSFAIAVVNFQITMEWGSVSTIGATRGDSHYQHRGTSSPAPVN